MSSIHRGLKPAGTLDISRISARPAGQFLKLFLQPRVPGSPASHKIQIALLQHFSELGWKTEIDRFKAPIPPKGNEITFTNLIFTLNPNAKKKLVLAAHYDSKVNVPGQDHDGQFIGATDSAWPCALILELSYALTPRLRNSPKFDDVSLQIIFFDGEEAHVHWSHDDSLYGARHLAKKWTKESPNRLSSIELFVLLDLLGASNPAIYPLIASTKKEYMKLAQIESELSSNLSYSTSQSKRYFYSNKPVSLQSTHIDDDHVPFMRLGVPVVHVISVPFPDVWHTMDDNESALDNGVIRDLTLIMHRYLEKYFELPAAEEKCAPRDSFADL